MVEVARTAYRTCPLCEAACGLELTVTGDSVTAARGDREHVFSHGFICPKGATFGRLADDPDRLRRPLIRRDGRHREATWDEAFAAVEAGLRPVVETYGPQAVAAYLGNPNVHTMAGGLYVTPLLKALGTRNVFTASTVDQMPKHVSCGYLFGSPLAIPVPDLDRTDLLLVLGANPWESNGSLATAADFPGRLRAIQARGGRFVVVDPRRTRTAEHADEHVFIRPGTDAFLLFGIVHTLLAEELANLGRLTPYVVGLDEVRGLAAAFPPERVAAACDIPAERIRGLARELAAAPTAAVYGRIGTCTVEFGTLTSWLVDVINVLTGNLDRPGGVMFPLAAHLRPHPAPGGRGFTTGRWRSRVRGLPEVKGELPVATLADEIETPGEGQVRAFLTVAGNPVLSAPNSGRLDRALAGLDFMVSVDPYLNETTRHADVILPPLDATRKGHYDFSFLSLAVRNFAAYSPPVLPPDPGGMDEVDILARLILIATGRGAGADPAVVHEHLLHEALRRAVGDRAAELRDRVSGAGPAERLLDVALRTGAYGDGFGAVPDGLSLDRLLAAPHGIDLGPLRPRIPEVLRTPSGRIELCAPALADEAGRLRAALDRPRPGLVLIGRRHLRSNNSWMHNEPALVKGRDRCTLQVHPDDADRLTLSDGLPAVVTARAGTVVAPVEVTDRVMPGVVSLPHGWGHDLPGVRLAVAAAHPGVNSNILTDELVIDPLSGNAVLNGIPVEVKPA
ncbi:molybdopterin oxidoreductase family protein [Actinoplanes teichomyceticus]|uniref:Anaerobic selenocysteine-containing dehydrogenase n=1 Tax=Actinoplanes teichomyceticus TaxID=1867 RepID=A0A561WK18_ACTTI|nr:molybdopterin oxidoreductase family protein [Actinoplanes teichomyceticus]TWG24219.1 anaerobic selenocysteine-containing dehydrogenase [Actinoplanes teichomyceticus]GIF12934.1 dehydrogenase [Actinoplanes teichomyceticus]